MGSPLNSKIPEVQCVFHGPLEHVYSSIKFRKSRVKLALDKYLVATPKIYKLLLFFIQCIGRNIIFATIHLLQVLVNCAGFSVPGRAYQMSDYDVKKMIDVNYLGSVKMTQALLPEMITHREGAIIFTSSVGGLVGIYGLAAYCGSKFAVRGYAEALAMGTVFLTAFQDLFQNPLNSFFTS